MIFGLTKLKLGLGIAALVMIALFAWTLKAQVNKIADLGGQVQKLKTDLASEQAARQRDVAGLTALSQGIIGASSARSLDEATLRETIDEKNPKPSSPGLAGFIDGLRRSDSPPPAPSAAAHPGGAPGSGAARPRVQR
jgi:hypothetical protein